MTMLPLWALISLGAAAAQVVRFALQKVLRAGALSTMGATFARFAFAAPVVLAGVACGLWLTGAALPPLGARFWSAALIGGLAQIAGTACVVALFARRNFAVGVGLAKTEVVLTAALGFVVLGDQIGPWAFAAILGGLVGVWLLSLPESGGFDRLSGATMALGLGSGALFAVSGVAYRAATLAVVSEQPLLRAAVTLAAATSMQALVLALYLRLREPGQLGAVWAARQQALWIGLSSLVGSLGWFTAFTLVNAAYVKAVGQVELVLALAVQAIIFRERITRREGWGALILTGAIVALILVA